MKVVTAAFATLLVLSIVVGAQQDSIVIRAARLLDGKGGMATNVSVVIQGSKIVRVDQSGQNATYDLGNLTLMPGWIDTHAHIVSHFDRATGRAHSDQARDETPQQAMLQRALEKHVKMVFGTDATAGALGRQYEELIYRVKDGGQDPMDAIVTATSKSAESIGLGAAIGTIAPGMEADIIATDGNPVQDITAVRRVTFVMKGGQVYRNARGR